MRGAVIGSRRQSAVDGKQGKQPSCGDAEPTTICLTAMASASAAAHRTAGDGSGALQDKNVTSMPAHKACASM